MDEKTLQKILQMEAPHHYRVAHRWDPREPVARLALECLRGRMALKAVRKHLEHRGDPQRDQWTRGALEGLLYWSKAAARSEGWVESLWLELRELLWTRGYPLDPRDDWKSAPDSARRLLADPLEIGSRVQMPIRSIPSFAEARDADVLLLWIHTLEDPGPTYQVVDVDGQIWITEEGREEPEVAAREDLLLLPKESLRQIRLEQTQYSADAYQAMMEWSPPTSETISTFYLHESDRFQRTEYLWA